MDNNLVNNLVKIANILDELGLFESADKIDSCAENHQIRIIQAPICLSHKLVRL